MTRCISATGWLRASDHSPRLSSSAWASSDCSTRRNVDSHGTVSQIPSLASVARSASAAHSAIATNERAPASTAHNANPNTAAS